MPPVDVTVGFLLQGVWYAAEQSGRLLEDARHLYERGRLGTATALALVAREELGKANILLALCKRGSRGEAVSLEIVRSSTDDHRPKQVAAQFSVSIRIPPGASVEQIETLLRRKARRLPDDRTRLREEALYVDPDEFGRSWRRPASVMPEQAQEDLFSANNDYSTFRMGLVEGHGGGLITRALARELEAWPDRPELPLPSWPNVPEEHRGGPTS